MPKEKRRRSGAHEQSVRLPTQRQSAFQDNLDEHVTLGREADLPAPDILADLSAEQEPRATLKKKDKLALKHELFLQRLEQSRSPYSKSHERRLKRKAREQVAGGLNEIKAALAAVEDEIPAAMQASVPVSAETVDTMGDSPRPKKVHPKPGLIGEGKTAPLSKSQRKRVLQLERTRIPMILATPEFAANPFQTLRTHAQNTLLKREPPAAS